MDILAAFGPVGLAEAHERTAVLADFEASRAADALLRRSYVFRRFREQTLTKYNTALRTADGVTTSKDRDRSMWS